MIVGYHAGGLDEPDIEKAADILHETGYAGIQVAGPVAKTIAKQDLWQEAGDIFADRGLRVLMSFGPAPSIEELASGDEGSEGYAKWRAEAEKVRLAGCEALMMMPKGPRGAGADLLGRAGTNFATFAKRLHGETGVRSSIHQHFNSPLETWDDIRFFACDIDGVTSALLADTAHLTKSGVDPARYLREYASRIDMLHIKDIDTNGAFRFPGQGAVDFDSFFSAVADLGFAGSVVADVHDVSYDGDLVSGARAWLAQRLAPAEPAFRARHSR